MAGKIQPGERRPDANETVEDETPKAWERKVVTPRNPTQSRATYRTDAPSPGEEILARYDAEVDDQPVDDSAPPEVFCF